MVKCKYNNSKIRIYCRTIKYKFKKCINILVFRTLRLILISKDNLQYWAFAINEEIKYENLIIIIDFPILDEIPESFPLDINPSWRINFSQNGEKTKIKVLSSHSLEYGRIISNLFELFFLLYIK